MSEHQEVAPSERILYIDNLVKMMKEGTLETGLKFNDMIIEADDEHVTNTAPAAS